MFSDNESGNCLVEFNEEFLALSYQWLTNDEIRKLTMAPPITKQEQKVWFEKLKNRTDYKVFGVSHNAVYVGVAGLKHIDIQAKSAEYFGYIGEKTYWGKGIGRYMIESMSKYAMSIGLKKMVLNVATYNTRAIKLYEKNGFNRLLQDAEVITMVKYLI